ncbi:glycosyltransferase [Ekhidna sp.]|uniref:glycosyltransferase n=1 Tax=Ekhidna sp. TaxID=2608089 RepID=UPI0035127CBA
MIFIVWSICCAIQIAFTLYLTIPFFFTKKNKGEGTFPSISIIIAARNELENLKKLIPLLLSQNHDDYQIVVALDRCEDQSVNYLQKLNSEKIKFIDIKDVPADWNPKKFALHTAIKQSDSEWLAFTDADCCPVSKDWLATLCWQIKPQTEIVLGISPYESNNSFLSQFIRFEAFMTAFQYISKVLRGKPYMGVGRNMAIKRSTFVNAGGYYSIKSIKGGDDDLLIQKIATPSNTSVVLGKDSLMISHPKKTWKEYWNQKTRHLSVGTSYKPADQLFLSTFHLSHLLCFVLLLFNPSYTYFFPLLLFYLFIKLVSYRFVAAKMGTGFNYMLLPLVDMLYAVLIPVIALWSKLVKDIPWKN